MYDTNLKDYPKFDRETSDSKRIQRAIDATYNGVLCIPRGDYFIDETLIIKNRCSLDMHPAARLIATKEMDFVLKYSNADNYNRLTLFNDDGSVYDNLGLFIRGGDIDGRGLASCFSITDAHHFTLSDIALHNGKEYGLCVGGDAGGHIYELICNNVYCKCTMKGLAGNVGIFTDRHDAHFNDCIVVDYTVGMRIYGSANRITRCHLWGGTVAPDEYTMEEWSDIYAQRKSDLILGLYGADARDEYNNSVPEMLKDSISFDVRGYCNVLDGCYADTAEIGYAISGTTRMINCDFANNKLMGLKSATAIKHTRGELTVISCSFRNSVGTEILYEGSGEGVRWIGNDSEMEVPDNLNVIL